MGYVADREVESMGFWVLDKVTGQKFSAVKTLEGLTVSDSENADFSVPLPIGSVFVFRVFLHPDDDEVSTDVDIFPVDNLSAFLDKYKLLF